MRARFPFSAALLPGLALALLLGSAPTAAQQYRSEARGVSEEELREAEGFDAESALPQVSDPYARAMLLSQAAAQAQARGDLQQALAHLREAVALDALSDFAEQRLQRDAGMLAAKLGDDEQVIALLSGLREGTDPAALRQLAAAYARSERWREAGGVVETLMQADKPSTEDRLLDATVAAQNRDWRRVLARTDEILAANPASAEAWTLRIRAQLGLGRKAQALASRTAAWRLKVYVDAEQRLALARDFADGGLPLAGASLLEEGLASGQLERSPEQLDQLAALWLAARENSEAGRVLRERLALAPSAEASAQLGRLALDAGDWDTAARALRAGLRLPQAARRAGVAMLLGQAEFQRGNPEAARRAFEAAAAHPPYRNSAQQWVDYLTSGQASARAVAGQAVGQGEAQRRSLSRIEGAGARPGQGSGQGRGQGIGGFTPVGAEAAGSADGRIPPWTGGLAQDDDAQSNPYADDAPIAKITAATMQEWRPWLAPGHEALLRRMPEHALHVYPSRRSVAYPEAIYEATQKNRGRARLLGSDALSGARLGFPFPAPDNGVEAMWNHRLRWRGEATRRKGEQAVVGPEGEIRNTLVQYEEMLARYAHLSDPADLARENILLYYLTTFGSGRGSPDFTVLVHESANSLERARAIWVLPKSFKKMFRIPPVGYDNPFPGSEGLFYVDMVDMYNGAFDHYDWKLAGKRELLVPYNAFAAQDYGAESGPRGLLHAGAPNPEALRYEVHRVWVIDATERKGASHMFGVRRFYLDEDSWNVVLVENYDRIGQLWRLQEGHLLPNRRLQSADSTPTITYDLKDGRYFAQRMTAAFGPGESIEPPPDKGDYRPANVRMRYAR